MSIYLSVDIDYWTNNYWKSNDSPAVPLSSSLGYLTLYAQKHNIPIVSMRNHHDMLAHVQCARASELVNIDAHSDLVDEGHYDINCGTWVKFVNWRKHGVYHWVRPNGFLEDGDCNMSNPIFHENGRANQKVTSWNLVKHSISAKTLKSLIYTLDDCVGIGVCSSPDWSSYRELNIFTSWRKSHNIPYTRGKEQ